LAGIQVREWLTRGLPAYRVFGGAIEFVEVFLDTARPERLSVPVHRNPRLVGIDVQPASACFHLGHRMAGVSAANQGFK